MANLDKWCFTWVPNRKAAPGSSDKAALLKSARWEPEDIISVSFLDGDEEVIQKVIRYAQEWTVPGLANVIFDFRRNTTDTLIRISFQYAGSWSVLGTTCRQITDRTEPTMNYGWLKPTTPDDEVRRVVLHEFGHALGLIHEHQNPKGAIQWERDKVIEDLSGPPNRWTVDQIEFNMFKPYELAEVRATPVDRDSIMMYPIPARWTTNGFSAALNTDLSADDRRLIREAYA
jgi:serralysin